MTISIPNLKVVSITRKIETKGSEPLLVICDDYDPYYVKNDRNSDPASTLINETYCHFLLKAWSIPTPNIALVSLEANLFKIEYGARHKPIYYDRLAFGSKEVTGAFDVPHFLQVEGKVEFRKYQEPLQFPRLGLFDMWTENDDRPPDLKNVMVYEKDEKFSFLAIDQAMTFRTGAYSSLNDQKFYPTEENYILQSQFFNDIKRFFKDKPDFLEEERKNFYICLEKSKAIFDKIAPLIPQSWGMTKQIETLMADFLFNEQRNKDVFEEYTRFWT